MQNLKFEDIPAAINILNEKLNRIESLLLKQESNSTIPANRILTVKETAKFLTLSIQTVYGLVRRSEISVSKKNKRLYFSQEELTNWIQTGRKKTNTEMEQDAKEYLINRKGMHSVK